MNQASDMLFIQSLAFFGKKWLFLEKNLKNDNFLNGIKSKTRQNKELKYRRKNMVCTPGVFFRNFFQINLIISSSILNI